MDASGNELGLDALPIRDELRRRSKRPWLTALLSIAIGLAWVVAQTVALVVTAVFLVISRGQSSADVLARADSDADFISIGTWAGTIVAVPLIYLVAKWQASTTPADLLGCKAPTTRQVLLWLGGLLAFIAMSDGLTLLSGRPLVPRVMQDIYASADLPILLWSTLIIAAPVFEELLFRGLLFRGLIETRLKFVGAAVVTSLIWSAIHVQYDLYGIASIFVGGLLLSAARYFTGSVFVCMLMHATMNLVATLELLWLSRGGGAVLP
jgi:membrane protease YdiL (CAAX protease family)